MIQLLIFLKEKTMFCKQCHVISDKELCRNCDDENISIQKNKICVVENIADPDGSSARPLISNVLREWVPKTDFSVKKANTTEWEYSLSETYLESANINLNEGDSSRYSIVISVHGDDLGNSSSMYVLAVDKTTLPSIHEQAKWSNFPLIILGNVVILVGICFIIIQERIREKGLPLLEGKILHSKSNEKEININIKTGNKKKNAKAGSAEAAAFIMQNAQNVVIVPGYGMAVAQAQHIVREMTDKLKSSGVLSLIHI